MDGKGAALAIGGIGRGVVQRLAVVKERAAGGQVDDLGFIGVYLVAAIEQGTGLLRALVVQGRQMRAGHQVHGAIGLTAEHALHRHSKTLWSWREEFGNEAEWNARLGALIAARGGDRLWPDIVASDG